MNPCGNCIESTVMLLEIVRVVSHLMIVSNSFYSFAGMCVVFMILCLYSTVVSQWLINSLIPIRMFCELMNILLLISRLG